MYFEAENEDGLRKVGYSKERWVDPQIVVGLLVDRAGFPLEIGCWEGNKAETATMIPIIGQFQDRHSLEGIVIAAPPEFQTRLQGLPGVKDVDGVRATRSRHGVDERGGRAGLGRGGDGVG